MTEPTQTPPADITFKDAPTSASLRRPEWKAFDYVGVTAMAIVLAWFYFNPSPIYPQAALIFAAFGFGIALTNLLFLTPMHRDLYYFMDRTDEWRAHTFAGNRVTREILKGWREDHEAMERMLLNAHRAASGTDDARNVNDPKKVN